MTVVSGSALLGGVSIPAGRTFTLVIDVDTALEEIVDATAVSTNTFTITRAIDGSLAQDHSAGAVVRHMAIGRDYRDANLHAEASAAYTDGGGNNHTMHGIATGEGSIVGTDKTQTLTNKTLTSPTISNPTFTGTPSAEASIIFEGSTADAYETTLTVVDPTQDNTITLPNTTGTVVIANAVQTLTNKTMGDALNAGGFRITNIATPVDANDAVNKTFADAQVAAAATSAASAATSASSAATSASSASTSASSALTSANSASASATAAATSATSAAASATSAANSASAAATSATSAAASATAAATSASSASTSASSALTSANSASTSATNAANSATAASTSASSASTSASSALTSANSASTSATSAANSATASATSASAAATSATSAATSASSAATSATSAAASATAAAASAASVDATATLAVEFRNYAAEGSVLNNLPARVHPGETLLKQAAYWIDSAHSSAAGQTITNLGYAGSVLPTTVGSSTSADSNDPKYLDWDGTNYVYTPGTTGNSMTVPDSTELDITGDIDLRVKVALDDWTPASNSMLLGKYGSGSQQSYYLQVRTTGVLRLGWTEDGSTDLTADSTVAPTVADGAELWVRATLDVDNGASGRDIKFFTSTDGSTWTQLGTTVTQAGVTSIFAGTEVLRIGLAGLGGDFTTGKFYRVQICNGIDAAPVLDVDTSQITSGAATSFTALTGQTVTITRATSGRKTVCVVHPVWLFGTDDYMEVLNRWVDGTAKSLYLPGLSENNASVPDSAALDITGDIDIRVKVAMDDWTPTSNQALMSKRAALTTNYSWTFFVSTDGKLNFNVSSNGTDPAISTVSSVAPTVADGATLWVRATLDVDNGASGNDVKFYTSTDGTNWTQLGTTVTNAGTTSIFNSSSAVRIGGQGGTSQPAARGRFFRAQVLNGIDGTVALDANFETSITGLTQTSFTESSTNAATVTIATSGTSYVSTPIVQSGYIYPTGLANLTPSSYSYLDFGASDSFTAVVIVRGWSTLPNSAIWLSKRVSSTAIEGAGYNLRTGSSGQYNQAFVISDNTTRITADGPSTLTAGTLAAFTAVRDVSADTITAYNNTTAGTAVTDTTTSGLSPSLSNLRIGRLSGSATNYIDMEFVAAAVFRRALTSAEITTIYNYYSGRVGA
jgi:hypothetical protein